MRAVNLLPQDEQPRSFAAYRGVAFGAGGGVALVSVALAALTISAGGAIQQQSAERDSLNAELAALPPAPVDQQESSTNAALVFEKNQRITALSSALSTRVAWDRVLSQISQVLPEDVWLTSLTSQSEPADASAATGAVAAIRCERDADRLDVFPARRRPAAGPPRSPSGAQRRSVAVELDPGDEAEEHRPVHDPGDRQGSGGVPVKRKLSPRALYAVVIGGVLVYALAFWFVAVSPKRAEASALKDEVAALQVTVASARLAAMPQKNDDTRPIEVADIFRLAKAMPSGPDMPGILLELSRIAEETGIEFQSVTPAAAVVAGGFQKVPISLAFDGNFYELSDFLFRLRTLVGVRGGELRAAGRLFSVESISFAESKKGFPELGATLSVVAYVYGTDGPASAGTPPAATTPPADPNAAAPAADPNAATPAPAPAAAPTGAEASP